MFLAFLLQELIEKLSKGELPKDEYHCLNDPSPSFRGIPSASTQTSPAHQPAQSMRSRTGGTWARPRDSDDGYSRFVTSYPHFYYYKN